MDENEQKARTIRNALSAEENLLEEIYHADNGNRPELYRRLDDLRKERHSLISDFYPTACPEPLHRAVSLMKEENTLESLFMKVLGSQNHTPNITLNVGTPNKADKIEKRLKSIRAMRDQALSEAEKCSVPSKSKDNRCYECEANSKSKKGREKREEIMGIFNKLMKTREGKHTEVPSKTSRTATKRTPKNKNKNKNNDMWNDVLWSILE